MKKAKLLFISQCYPYPLDGGGKIRTFSTLSAIAKLFEVHCVFVSERKPTPEQQLILKRLGIAQQTIFLTTGPKENIKKNILKLARNYLRLRPHYVYQYEHAAATVHIRQLLENIHPSVIVVDHLNSTQFLPKPSWLAAQQNRPTLVLENHNLIHNFYFSRMKQTSKLVRKLYLLLEGSLNFYYEKKHYPRFDTAISISKNERKELLRFNRRVVVSPTWYPISHYRKVKKQTIDLVFIGYLDWPPNQDGLEWFIEQVFQPLHHHDPSISLLVIGHSDSLGNWKQKYPFVRFVGNVSNITSLLSKSKIFVVPIFSGSGLNIKILTGLSAGLPILSTQFGIRGYSLKPNQDFLVANNAKTFLSNIQLLLKSSTTRKHYEEQSLQQFSKIQQTALKDIRKLYQSFVASQ